MATTSDAQVDATTAAATAADLPQKPTNPQGTLEDPTCSPQIKPERVPDAEITSASDRASLPPVPPVPFMGPMPKASSHRAIQNGPSPQKGSGQERFRQMISGQVVGKAFPPAPPTVYPQLPGLNPQGSQLPSAIAYCPRPMNAPNGRPASVNPPLPSQFYTAATGYGKDNAISRAGSVPAPNKDAGANNGTNGSSNNAAFRTTYTAILSSECQSRRFNPQFTEWTRDGGKYYAKVQLLDHTICDGRAYKNTMEAKQALAKQAIAWVRANMPKDANPSRAAAVATQKQEQMNRERADRGQYNGFYYDLGTGNGNGLANGMGYPGGGSVGGSHYRPSQDRASRQDGAVADDKKSDDRRELLERIRSLYGHVRGPSEAVLADPTASRAFLEGFALSDRLRESAVRAERRRSRSPKGGGDRGAGRGYRDRSAARRSNFSAGYT
ncbi:hypothetical protein PG994_008447 [Apiospora phragmitis]|uniref:DRBM domain-containing protein n=1 Tax=Apiospora phragmitis TaxID=2905665 RepID=A0ABR1UGH3_9PEZI